MKTYSEQLTRYSDLGFSADFSRLPLTPSFLDSMSDKIARAFQEMDALEAGAIANPDENRMVGHYWLRNSDLAPTEELKEQIESVKTDIIDFAAMVLDGEITPPDTDTFTTALVIGIGGSALGPELVADALRDEGVGLNMVFLDNTDPDGMRRTLVQLELAQTLVVVISKSGGTPETRNGMLVVQNVFKENNLNFAKQAVAITGKGSHLDKVAEQEGWLRRFPMEDWVGGRTSVTSVVGLLPAALQGIDIEAFLEGAAAMDEYTRLHDVSKNAAMKLALAWYKATDGQGKKDMVVLPYKDSLVLFSKYLQQLVMESLGKKEDLDGNTVHQGLTVYGNKGSTDQHAYVQQLRDGLANFFVTFIEVRDINYPELDIEVDPGTKVSDYLQGFLRGTRQALTDSGRESITISISDVSDLTLGMLIALFERAVTFYASLVHINAYHQPGVEAGKKAASSFLKLLNKVRSAVQITPETAAEIAARVGENDVESVYHCLVHMAACDCALNDVVLQEEMDSPDQDTFRKLTEEEIQEKQQEIQQMLEELGTQLEGEDE